MIYNIYHTNRVQSVLCITIPILLIVISAAIPNPLRTLVITILFIALLLSLFLLSKLLSRAKLEILLKGDSLQILSVKSVLPTKIHPSSIRFETLKDFLYEPSVNMCQLQLQLRDDSKLTLNHELSCKDDFNSFLSSFRKAVASYNLSADKDFLIIEQQKFLQKHSKIYYRSFLIFITLMIIGVGLVGYIKFITLMDSIKYFLVVAILLCLWLLCYRGLRKQMLL